MRSTIFSLFLLLAGSLSAQNYIQNAPPVQQTKAAIDCYTRNLDNGNAALRRGENREALRFFTEAKNCPDAQGNSRRINEIDARIERCEILLGLKKTAAEPVIAAEKSIAEPRVQKRSFTSEPSTIRRNYKPSQSFLKDTLDDCFGRMVAEADRAYRLKFWEDAAALYRAAKNCSDAEQKDRQKMSEKIAACRNAAENELFAKQQEAERQARHAIAANLADDAQELLRTTDRSLAFRLADFANQYIAPEDNPDCVQAMFDAWYYQPNEESKNREEELYRPAFSYELADNLGENTQVKFEQQKDGSQWLWAFVPNSGDMYAWEMPGMKLVQSFGTGEYNTYQGFDISPSGDLLFWGSRFFDLRKGTRSLRIDVPRIASWCFSKTGNEFFYQHVGEESVYVLDVKKSFDQQTIRKGAKISNNIQPVAAPQVIQEGVPASVMSMKFVDGKLWFGFIDHIEVVGRSEPEKRWRVEKVIPFEGLEIPDIMTQKDLTLEMFPEEGFAVLGHNQRTWVITLDEQALKGTAKALTYFRPIGISPGTHRMACEYTGLFNYNTFLLLDLKTGDTLLRQQIPAAIDFNAFKGCYAPNARWIAAATSAGNVSVWALQDAPTVWSAQLTVSGVDNLRFSPDGSKIFVHQNDSLQIFNSNTPKAGGRVFKNFGLALVGATNQWSLIQVSPDSAALVHLSNGSRIGFPLKNEGSPFLYVTDVKGENIVAYLSDWNKVEVRSIKTGALISSKVFEGGSIGALFCVPGSDKLLVVQHFSSGESTNAESTVKIWSPYAANEKPRALRLHEYAVHTTAIDTKGEQAAFSDGSDIRIFDLQNIENELIKIRAAASELVLAIAFKPGSNLLAAAYSTGKIVFWDAQTGQALLRLQAVPANELLESYLLIQNIGFSQNGTVLHIALSDGRLLSFALDPSYIRSVAQNENKHLQSFVAEHIVRYNLEAALYYPGNFERLAESGDNPLIRSFFQYFREQAIESNNIMQVRNYCERAFYLYERLDDNTKLIWRPEMNAMYDDYARKLLFRGNITEASGVISFIKKEFGTESILLNAHKALLTKDFEHASALYSNFLLTNDTGQPLLPDDKFASDQTKKDLFQLKDYELIDSVQLDCFCGTVQYSTDFQDFCPERKANATAYLSPLDQTRWEIFQKRSQANNTLQFSLKTRLLEEARQKAKRIALATNPAAKILLETITLELAVSYRKWGVFEINSPEAATNFEKAIQILAESGPFKSLSDSSRLALISSTRLAWGKHLFDTGKTEAAALQFYQGLESAQLLSEIVYEADTALLIIYYDNIVGPLYEKMGTALLHLGKTEEARQAYERAVVFNVNRPTNSLYAANVSVLEQDEPQAFIDYGSIAYTFEAAIAFFELNRLAREFPQKRAYIEQLVPTLRAGLASKNERLVGPEMDFWFAKYQSDYFLGLSKLDSAVFWSRKALESAAKCKDLVKEDDDWKRRWLDEHVNLPYLLLQYDWKNPALLNECIQYAETAEAYLSQLDSVYFYYANRALLKTNLAHALLLRNSPGDQEKALEQYRLFVDQFDDPRGYDNRDLLKKDIRDLKRLGAQWPEVPALEKLLNEEDNQ